VALSVHGGQLRTDLGRRAAPSDHACCAAHLTQLQRGTSVSTPRAQLNSGKRPRRRSVMFASRLSSPHRNALTVAPLTAPASRDIHPDDRGSG